MYFNIHVIKISNPFQHPFFISFSSTCLHNHLSNTNTHGIRHGAETIHPLFLDNKFVHVYSHKMTKTLNVIFI